MIGELRHPSISGFWSLRTVEPTLLSWESNIRAACACPAWTGTLTAAHEDTHLMRPRF